jgi:outer membrane protein
VKARRFSLLLIGSLMVSGAVLAAQEYKIAVIDAARVAEASPQKKAWEKVLQEEFSRRQEEIIGKQDELHKLEDKLEREGSSLSDTDRQGLQREIISRARVLKNTQDEYREDLALRQNELRAKLATQVREAVVEVAKAENVDVILGDGVVFSSKRVDISDKVIAKMEEQFKASRK